MRGFYEIRSSNVFFFYFSLLADAEVTADIEGLGLFLLDLGRTLGLALDPLRTRRIRACRFARLAVFFSSIASFPFFALDDLRALRFCTHPKVVVGVVAFSSLPILFRPRFFDVDSCRLMTRQIGRSAVIQRHAEPPTSSRSVRIDCVGTPGCFEPSNFLNTPRVCDGLVPDGGHARENDTNNESRDIDVSWTEN